MRTRQADLTPVAVEGYNAPAEQANPYLYSSSNWFAFQIGRYLQRTGRTIPRGVRMGRGYNIHANDMLFRFDARNNVLRVD